MGNQEARVLRYDMRGTICIVTGANTGIGKETAFMLAGAGAHVILACRSLERGNDALKQIQDAFPTASAEVMQLDLSDFDQIKSFITSFSSKHSHLDILVNNAGVFKTKHEVLQNGYEHSFCVNHLGHFLLTTLLLPFLEKSPLNPSDPSHTIQTPTSPRSSLTHPRIVLITAEAYTLAGPLKLSDLTNSTPQTFSSLKNQLTHYGKTKLCNLLFMEELNTRIKEYGSKISINSLQPGWVNTEINRENKTALGNIFNTVGSLAAKTPQEGAICSLFVACDPSLNNKSGKYFIDPFKEGIVRDFACSQKDAKELWEFSETAVGTKLEKWF